MNTPNSIVGHRIEAFDQRHGGREGSVHGNGWIYYSDGARREVDPMGALIPPPVDEYELAMAKLNYAKARLAQAQSAFFELKDQLLTTTPNGAGEQDLAQLKKLKGDVEFAQAALSKAEQALAETETFKRRREAKEGIATRKQAQANWRSKVLAVAGVGVAEDEDE